jgi:hypothetical protein
MRNNQQVSRISSCSADLMVLMMMMPESLKFFQQYNNGWR